MFPVSNATPLKKISKLSGLKETNFPHDAVVQVFKKRSAKLIT